MVLTTGGYQARRTCASRKDTGVEPDLTIIHFNDVYDIFPSESEPVGGAARFAKLVKDQCQGECRPLILFSGDCLNPSTLSAFTKGEHMVPIMNTIGVDVAALGVMILILGFKNWRRGWRNLNFPGLFPMFWTAGPKGHLLGQKSL
eukprot:jgi/Picre1/35346/NNA_002808.t1